MISSSHILSGSPGNLDTGSTSESEFDAFFFRLLHALTRQLPQEKQDKVSIVELKNRKVVFKQKPISFEKQSDTLQGACILHYGLLELD